MFVDNELQQGFALPFPDFGANDKFRLDPAQLQSLLCIYQAYGIADPCDMERIQAGAFSASVLGDDGADISGLCFSRNIEPCFIFQLKRRQRVSDLLYMFDVRVLVLLEDGPAFQFLRVYRGVDDERRKPAIKRVIDNQLRSDEEPAPCRDVFSGDTECDIHLDRSRGVGGSGPAVRAPWKGPLPSFWPANSPPKPTDLTGRAPCRSGVDIAYSYCAAF